MNPIREDFDVQCFVGATLYELCLNANQMRLLFDTGLKIIAEGNLVLRSPSADDSVAPTSLAEVIITPQSPNLELFRLIECQISSVRLSPNRMNLLFVFSSGQSLELIGDDPYECYRIQIEDEEIIV